MNKDTCWYNKFGGDKPCGRLATWRGPMKGPTSFDRAWRACGEHKQDSDIPYQPVSSVPEKSGGESDE